MSKKNTKAPLVPYVVNGQVTPEMLENPEFVAKLPKDAVRYVKDISKAQKTAESSSLTIAYNLAMMNIKRADGYSYSQKFGFANVRDYAQVYHNISDQTCRMYVNVAERLIVRDKSGIHSKYAEITINPDTEKPEITQDFTVSQLIELNAIAPAFVKMMQERGTINYDTRTRILRNIAVAIKAQLPTGTKISELTDGQKEEICVNAEIALTKICKEIDARKAIASVLHPESETAQETTQETAQDTTQETAQETAQDTTQGTHSAPVDLAPIDVYAAIDALESAFIKAVELAKNEDEKRLLNDTLLTMVDDLAEKLTVEE